MVDRLGVVPDTNRPTPDAELEVDTDAVAVAGPAVYVAGPDGFTAAGRHHLRTVVHPALRTRGWGILDPWTGADALVAALALPPSPERRSALAAANDVTGARNADMIDTATAVLAVLDGADVDSGTAAEIGWAAARGIPVVGWRSDLRTSGDNEAALVNLQVEHFVRRSGGAIAMDLDAALDLLDHLRG